jgi:hypothetical protein
MAKKISDQNVLTALAMQGAVIIMDAAKAGKDMTAESLKKMEKSIQEKLFIFQATPKRRKNKSPAHRSTKDKSPSLPTRASITPPRGLSRSPPLSRSASNSSTPRRNRDSPAPMRTSKSPSPSRCPVPKGTKRDTVPKPRQCLIPIGYSTERYENFSKNQCVKLTHLGPPLEILKPRGC